MDQNKLMNKPEVSRTVAAKSPSEVHLLKKQRKMEEYKEKIKLYEKNFL